MVNAVWGDIVETPIYRVSPVGEEGRKVLEIMNNKQLISN